MSYLVSKHSMNRLDENEEKWKRDNYKSVENNSNAKILSGMLSCLKCKI